jgi:hypothetical protein
MDAKIALATAKDVVENKNRMEHAVKMCDVSLNDIVNMAEVFLVLIEQQAKLITLYAVYQGGDDRNIGKPKWFFESKVDADDVAFGRGWCNSNAPVREVSVLKVGPSVYSITSTEPIAVNVGPQDDKIRRALALNKLTESEKKLLGLKP